MECASSILVGNYANYMSSHVYCNLKANGVVSLFGVFIVILATNIVVALFGSRGLVLFPLL